MSRTTEAIAMLRAGATKRDAAEATGLSLRTIAAAAHRAGLGRRPAVEDGCEALVSLGRPCGAVPVVLFGARRYCALHRAPLEAVLRGSA